MSMKIKGELLGNTNNQKTQPHGKRGLVWFLTSLLIFLLVHWLVSDYLWGGFFGQIYTAIDFMVFGVGACAVVAIRVLTGHSNTQNSPDVFMQTLPPKTGKVKSVTRPKTCVDEWS